MCRAIFCQVGKGEIEDMGTQKRKREAVFAGEKKNTERKRSKRSCTSSGREEKPKR